MTNTEIPKQGEMRVWWIPQIPGKSFKVPVTTPVEAKKILDVLAQYDLFQLENNIKPDYCNAGGLECFQQYPGDDPEWCEWYSDDGESIDEVDLAQ